MKSPKFSIIIPNFNGEQFLRPCLESVLSCHQVKQLSEIIVVDNGSTDHSCELITTHFPDIKIVKLPTNTGFTGAIATGVQVAQGEYLIFLNNDMHVSKEWLLAYDAYFTDSKNNVCATGLILDWEGKKIDFIRGILMFDGHALQIDQGKTVEEAGNIQQEDTLIGCGGNMAVKRDLFMALGGFDKDFFAYTEDVDFSWRLYASGYKITFLPKAMVFHYHQGTSSRFGIYRRGFLYERNAFLTIYKNIDEEFFDKILHATWITLLHRTREIMALHSNAASILESVPFSNEANTPRQLSPAITPTNNLIIRCLETLKKYGPTYTIGKILSHMGDALQKKFKETKPASSSMAELSNTLAINHPHIISQLQTIWYILTNMENISHKRKEIQRMRKVPDHEIFQIFPLFVVNTYPGDEQLFSTNWFKELLPQGIQFRFASLSEINKIQ
jgi:GT2 family glycosyltransferase